MTAAMMARTGGLRPFTDFGAAATRVLEALVDDVGFDMWALGKLRGEQWIVMSASANDFGVTEGLALAWDDTICSRMIAGHGPRIAPTLADVGAYADTPLARRFGIRAYAGAALYRPDGSLLGTVCGVSAAPAPEGVTAQLPAIDLSAQLLSTLALGERRVAREAIDEERRNQRSYIDPATGLYGLRAWERMLEQEDERARRYGYSSALVVIDLGPAGPSGRRSSDEAASGELANAARDALCAQARGSDVVARTGPRQLSLLAVQCRPGGAALLARRIADELGSRDIGAQIAVTEHHGAALDDAWRVMARPKRAAARATAPKALTYERCGACDRRGAYVAPRFPVLRCKLCGASAELSEEEWARTAGAGFADLAAGLRPAP